MGTSEPHSDPNETKLGFEIEQVPNWPGYEYPLACRVIRATDAHILYPVMKRSAKHLKGYIAGAKRFFLFSRCFSKRSLAMVCVGPVPVIRTLFGFPVSGSEMVIDLAARHADWPFCVIG